MANNYDVIIIGGRVSGCATAIRLGKQGLRVLLLERSKLPNANIVSSPVIAPAAMALLDEMETLEAHYAHNTPRLSRLIVEVRQDFVVTNKMANGFGRDYGYAIDRARFDFTLWQQAATLPTVTVLDAAPVIDLIGQENRVTGVYVLNPDKTYNTYTADCIVGADGRYSFVARKVKSEMVEETKEYPTSIYFAYWTGVAPYDATGPVMHAISLGDGIGFTVLESADNTAAVVAGGRMSAFVPPDGRSIEEFYLQLLQSHPSLRRRLIKAERVSPVRGMKNVGHFYRRSHGTGWVLVGDAVHAVDPIDGQGIFDALFSAKALSQAIISWRQGEETWERAMERYDQTLLDETYPMYRSTQIRRKVELYSHTREWMYRSTARWLLNDNEYKWRMSAYIGRCINAENWLPPYVIIKAIFRGMIRDLWGLLKKKRLFSAQIYNPGKS